MSRWHWTQKMELPVPDPPIFPVKPHPMPSRRDEGLFGDRKQAIEANTERANFIFIRISFG
jgi:hypothetical protein